MKGLETKLKLRKLKMFIRLVPFISKFQVLSIHHTSKLTTTKNCFHNFIQKRNTALKVECNGG